MDVFSIPDKVSKRPSSFTLYYSVFDVLSLESILRYAGMENLPQKVCLSLVGIFSIMNFSTKSQISARKSAALPIKF